MPDSRSNPTPQIIASDVDGTLLTSAHSISPDVCAAVNRAQRAGVDIVLASARGPLGMKHLLEELGGDGPFIAFQGALVGRFSPQGHLEVLHETRLDLTVARTVVELGTAAGSTVNWFDGEDWFFSKWDVYGEWEAKVNNATPTGQIGPAQMTAPNARGPHKLMLPPNVDDPELVPRIAANLPDGAVAHLSGEHYLEITAPNADKSHALEALCADRGIPLAAVCAVGDGPNDVGMFDLVGTAVAMANASPEVQARATWVTASNDDDGLALAINRLLG